MADHPLSQRIATVLDLQPDARAIEYGGRWLSWGEVGEAAWRIASLTAQHSAEPQIGMLLRNRPGQVAAFLGVLLGGGALLFLVVWWGVTIRRGRRARAAALGGMTTPAEEPASVA